MTVTGSDLLVQAKMLQKMPFTDIGGENYLAPGVLFTPWYDLQELLDNHDDNVVGRITSVSRSQGNIGNIGNDFRGLEGTSPLLL